MKPNYNLAKRQREQAKKKKQEEKAARKKAGSTEAAKEADLPAPANPEPTAP